MKRTAIVVGVTCLALSSIAGSAQSVRTSTLDDVVSEIRALRADLNQTSSVTVRTQLLVARLQLQEQRIASVGKQLLDAQTQLSNVQPGNAMMANQIKAEEERLQQAPAAERSGREQELKHVKFAFEQASLRERTLRTQVEELIVMLATEQSRWTEFNDRIDALERALPAK